MKRFLIVLTAICCCGCNKTEIVNKTNSIENATVYYRDLATIIYSIEIEGHAYIILDAGTGGSIIHAEHCKCKNRGQ